MGELDPKTEYADYLRSTGMGDDEIRSTLEYEEYQKTGAPPVDNSTWYGNAGRGVLKALDYTSSLGRGAIAGGIQEGSKALNSMGADVAPVELGVNFHDVVRGKTPDTEELMRRGDVPEMDFAPDWKYVPSGRKMIGFAGDVLADPVTYIPFVGQAKAAGTAAKLASKAGKVGEVVNKAGRVVAHGVGDTIAAGGKKLWKSGFGKIDTEALKYGKEPVSDLLVKHGVTGSERSIYNQMDELGVDLLNKRNAILDDATKAGAQVDMNRAMQPGRDFLGEMRAVDDPTLVGAVDKMQGATDLYAGRAAHDAKALERELPGGVGQESQKYFDEILPAQSGPSPNQVSQWKSNAYQSTPDAAYREALLSDQGLKFQKNVNRGLKEATEESVGKTLGTEAQQKLVTHNKELGQILTTKDRQLMEAARADGKNWFTSVDGILLPVMGKAALIKKAADFAKLPIFRTNAGKLLNNAGKHAPEAGWRQLLLQPTTRDGLD